MGWKLSCIMASQREQPWFPEPLRHDPAFAKRIAAAIPFGAVKPDRMTTFDEVMEPRGQVAIGAYDRGLIICEDPLNLSCFNEGGHVPPVIHAINTLLPGATILTLNLHSVVDLYAYALFEGTELVRVRSGCADEGVMIDSGDWLPEEVPYLSRVEVRDGEEIYYQESCGEWDESDHASVGERIVFDLSARCFGRPIDSFEFLDFPLQIFSPAPRPFWKRWLGR